MNKTYIIIASNRSQQLLPETIAVINKTKTPTILVKQNLRRYYRHHPYITEIISRQTGVSRGRNLGIKYAISKGAEILALTDDDCIITQRWINNIKLSFANPNTNIVFGRTLPYRPQKNPNLFCPSTFSKDSDTPITSPVSTWQKVGMSNNMAITPKLVHSIGLFSPKIGPGTRIPGGEDADYIIRAIKHNFSIFYNHQAILYHNRWLSPSDLQGLYRQYTLSFAYIYCFHSLHTDTAYTSILLRAFIKEIYYYFPYIRQVIHPLSFLKLIHNHNLIIFNFIKGCMLSLSYP